MTRLGPPQVGLFLDQQTEELVRIWRLARATARTEVFPGLIDGVVGPFFARAGNLLPSGAPPENVWRGLEGGVRWPPAVAPGELEVEWDLVAEVLTAACESVNAAPDVSAWLEQAVAACRAGTPRVVEPAEAPEGILAIIFFSSVAPPQVHEGDEDTVS